MKPTPEGWPRISSALYYEDAPRAIDWLCEAFGFAVRIRITGDDGRVVHSELTFGDGVIMVAEGDAKPRGRRAPAQIDGANTQNLLVQVEDVDAHFERTRGEPA